MTGFQTLLIRLGLFSLSWAVVLAAPVDGRNDELLVPRNTTQPGKLVPRAPGDTASDPIDITFDITGWPNIAEENCYAMLCLLNGNRV